MIVAGIETPHCKLKTGDRAALLFFYKKYWVISDKCIFDATISRSRVLCVAQGGRTWQPFVGGKNGHENFCQALTYNFRDKCVVFARNRKFANLTP